MLKQLVYISRAVRPMSDEDLLRILTGARRKNKAINITGLLVYKDLVFLQVLEGEQSNIQEVWEIIQADSRHANILELSYESLEQREFPDWSMGFVNFSGFDPAAIPGYSDFLNPDYEPEQLRLMPGLAREILLEVKNHNVSDQ